MSFYWSLKLTGQLFVSGWKKKYCISAFLISLPSRSCETNHTQTGDFFFLKIKTLRVVLIRQTLELTCPFVPASVPIFYTSQHTWNNDLPISSQIMTGGTETFRWRCQCFSLITPLLHWGTEVIRWWICALNLWFPRFWLKFCMSWNVLAVL